MADNTVLPGTGETYAAKDRGGVKHQKVLTEAGDSPSLDAFGRFRVSNPTTLFDSKFIGSDKGPLFWDELLESGGGITATTPSAEKPYLDFVSTVSTAGKLTRQTFRRFNYEPGKSQLLWFTGVINLSGGGAGVERRVGYFDDNNGLFFEDNESVMGVTVRSNNSGTPVDTTVVQADWNLDKMDGAGGSTNPSGFTVDWTKAQIFIVDFQWLSTGRVRFGLDLEGTICYVHQVVTANILEIPWCSTPNLPLRFQMITTSASPVSSMRQICSTIISEGGVDPVGHTHAIATVSHVNANIADTIYALLGIRLRTTHLGATVEVREISILSETNDNFEWLLLLNPTVAGTFTYSDFDSSVAQSATGNTDNPSSNTVTGGICIARGFGASQTALTLDLNNLITLGASINGTRSELVLAIRPLGSNADIQGALTWKEII